MTTTQTRTRTSETPLSSRGAETRPVDPRAEFQAGAHEAQKLLMETARLNPTPDLPMSEKLRARAEEPGASFSERAKYAMLSDVSHSIDVQREMDAAKIRRRAGDKSPKNYAIINARREDLVDNNLLVKSYLDADREKTIHHTHGLLTAAAQMMRRAEGQDPCTETDVKILRVRILGMRAELGAEQLWTMFESLEIEYAMADDDADKQDLEASGIDYIVTATLFDEEFELELDVKGLEKDTIGLDGRRIEGKIWNQCADKDYKNDTCVVNNLNLRATAMQKALAEQLLLQYPQRIRNLCDAKGIKPEDLWMYIE